MATPVHHGESLRDLLSRLIDQGKLYAQAELTVVKRTALSWVTAAKFGIAFGVVALFVAQAALTTLLVALGFSLATWVGPAGGLAIAGLIGMIVAGVFGYLAASRLSEGGK